MIAPPSSGQGEIVGHEFDNKCTIKYFELHEGDDDEEEEEKEDDKGKGKGKADEGGAAAGEEIEKVPFVQPEPIKYVRPVPPALEEVAYSRWVASLVPGSAADLRYDGGWWEVELVRVERHKKSSANAVETSPPATAAGGARATKSAVASVGVTWLVRSVHYDAEHEADLSELRPPHAWDEKSGAWSLRPAPEVLFLGGKLRSLIEDERTEGRRKKKDAKAKEQEGAPKEKANAYGLGTRRKGMDGQMWEVVHRGSKDGDASGLVEIWRPISSSAQFGGREPSWLIEEKAKAKRRKAVDAGEDVEDDEDDEDEDDDEQRSTEIDMAPVMEHEMREKGISAKKVRPRALALPPPPPKKNNTRPPASAHTRPRLPTPQNAAPSAPLP